MLTGRSVMFTILQNRLRKLFFAVTLGSFLCIAPPVTTDAAEAGNSSLSAGKWTLVLGKVSDNPKKHYRYLKPMVDYVAEHMKDLGITETKVLMARDNRQMISYLQQGKIDWVTETPFSAVIFQDKAGAELLVRKWKKGVPVYHSVLFTRKDSGINSLADLKGKTIAFEDPGSTSAYFVPASVLIRAGLGLVRLYRPREKPPSDKVGYVFSGEEINTSTWVQKGLVDAGAYSNLDWEKEGHLPQRFTKELKIIHRTKEFPRAVELTRKGLDPRIKQRLMETLLNAHNDPQAKKALRAYQKTKKFDEIDEQLLAGLEEVRLILKILRSKLE